MRFSTLLKKNHTTRFYRNLSILIALVIVLIYLGLYLRSRQFLMDAVKQQAVSYFDLIVRVRRWNAGYGGVYVEKKGGVETNAYLREVGVESDLVALDGRVFTLRNPALMTKEISNIFSEMGGIQFHITSEQLLNKENAADPFELRAFNKFREGEREFWEVESVPSGRRFRYMAPLFFEQSCDKCHFKFGYKVGDVRGGISISIPFKPIENAIEANRNVIIGLFLMTLLMLFGTTFMMFSQLLKQIKDAQRALQEASVTDELTGLRNRRYLMQRYNEEFERARRLGSQLGFIMLDLDNFKGVNDSCGHPFGDLVLKSVARAIGDTVREYDVAGRYGGEEFAVIVSEASKEDILVLAERIRETIAALDISDGKICVRVTMSIGVAALSADDTTETLLKRSDDALYKAKHEGHNRTAVL